MGNETQTNDYNKLIMPSRVIIEEIYIYNNNISDYRLSVDSKTTWNIMFKSSNKYNSSSLLMTTFNNPLGLIIPCDGPHKFP